MYQDSTEYSFLREGILQNVIFSNKIYYVLSMHQEAMH